MNDMISKTAAVELIERMYKACEGSLSDYHDLLVAAFIDLPPVDAVQVVRCRDCKHGSLQSNETKTYHCLEHNAMMEPHYYCILGERPQYKHANHLHCPKCGGMWMGNYNFCPNCGADMKEDGEHGKIN